MTTRPKNSGFAYKRDEKEDEEEASFEGTQVRADNPLNDAFSERTVVVPFSELEGVKAPPKTPEEVPPPKPRAQAAVNPAVAQTPTPAQQAKKTSTNTPPPVERKKVVEEPITEPVFQPSFKDTSAVPMPKTSAFRMTPQPSPAVKVPPTTAPVEALKFETPTAEAPAPQWSSYSGETTDKAIDIRPDEVRPSQSRFGTPIAPLDDTNPAIEFANEEQVRPSLLEVFKNLPRNAQIGIGAALFFIVVIILKAFIGSDDAQVTAAANKKAARVVAEEAPAPSQTNVQSAAQKPVAASTGTDAILVQFDQAFARTQSQAKPEGQ